MAARLSHQILAITFFKLLLNIGRRFVYPFAPALSRGLDVPLSAITAIIATTQVSSLAGLFCGPYADTLGYRRMMRAGLGLLGAGMLLCAVAPVYGVVFLGLTLASFGKILFDPAVQAYLGREVPYSSRGRAIGITEISWAGSTLIGIPILGMIIEYNGLSSSFYILGVLGFLAFFAIGKVMPQDVRTAAAPSRVMDIIAALKVLVRSRPAAGMVVFGFWISMANDAVFVVYGAWFESDFNITLVSLGFSTAVIGAAELLGESVSALFADRSGLKRSVIVGALAAILAYLLLPVIGVRLSFALVGVFLIFLAFEFTIVTSFSLCTALLPASRATVMAGYYASAGFGRMCGVLLGGAVWRAGGIGSVAILSAAMTALGLVSLLWGLKGWKPVKGS